MAEAVRSGNLERQHRVQQEIANSIREYRLANPNSNSNSNSNRPMTMRDALQFIRDERRLRRAPSRSPSRSRSSPSSSSRSSSRGSNSNSNANSNSNSEKRKYQPFPTTPRSNKTSSKILWMIREANDFLETHFHYDNHPSNAVRNKMNADTLKNEIMHGPHENIAKNTNKTGFRVDPRRSGHWFRWPTNSELNHWMTWWNWKEVELKKLPNQDPVSYNNFRNGSKAVKVTWKAGNKNHTAYFTLDTIAALRGMSTNNRKSNTLVMKAMEKIRKLPPHESVFKNPLFQSRNKVKRGDIMFVILKKKSTNKNKAATKIQAAFRGGRERQKTLNKAKRTAALITKKRRRN